MVFLKRIGLCEKPDQLSIKIQIRTKYVYFDWRQQWKRNDDDSPPKCFVARLSCPCQSVSHQNQPKMFQDFKWIRFSKRPVKDTKNKIYLEIDCYGHQGSCDNLPTPFPFDSCFERRKKNNINIYPYISIYPSLQNNIILDLSPINIPSCLSSTNCDF